MIDVVSIFVEMKLIRINLKVQSNMMKINDFPDPLELYLIIRIYHFALQLGSQNMRYKHTPIPLNFQGEIQIIWGLLFS